MNNWIQPGKTITLIAPRALASGAAFMVGSIFGIAKSAAAIGANVETELVGVVDIVKAAGAVTQGQKLYWDNVNFVVTTVAGGNTQVGVATQAAAAGDVTARMLMRHFD